MKKATHSLMIALLGALLCGATLYPAAAATAATDTQAPAPKVLPFEVGMYRVQNTLTMNLMVAKKPGERVGVKLLDQQGKVLYEEVIGRKQRRYARKLNFAEIKDGNYSVVISNGTDEIVKAVRLSTFSLYEMPARTLVAVN
jgi:hypothetical protein